MNVLHLNVNMAVHAWTLLITTAVTVHLVLMVLTVKQVNMSYFLFISSNFNRAMWFIKSKEYVIIDSSSLKNDKRASNSISMRNFVRCL